MGSPRAMSDEEPRHRIAEKYGEKWDASSVDVQDPIVAEVGERGSGGEERMSGFRAMARILGSPRMRG